MKRGLLVPTGNIECDLISFAANKQHSATSPVYTPSQGKDLSQGCGPKRGSAYRGKQARPLTEYSARLNPHCDERQSRVRSAHVLRMFKSSESRSEESASLRDEEKPTPRARALGSVQRWSRRKRSTEIDARSKLDVGQDFILSLSQDASTARLKAKEAEVDLSDDLQRNVNLQEEKRVRVYVERNPTRSLRQAKPKLLRFEAKKSIKKSKKRVKRNKSVLPLPTGSSFDNLVRSGDIAKHVAKKERNFGGSAS